MRDGINFEELIDKIDFILNSSKPLPYYMRKERELAELVKHLKEIPKYETLKQFELLFDVEPFLMHFLTSTDYTKLLKITDRTTMKYKHLDGYTFFYPSIYFKVVLLGILFNFIFLMLK